MRKHFPATAGMAIALAAALAAASFGAIPASAATPPGRTEVTPVETTTDTRSKPVFTFPEHFAAPYLRISDKTSHNLMASKNASGVNIFTLAFVIPTDATKCLPQWEAEKQPIGAFSKEIQALRDAGGEVIVSFGGAAGGELAQACTTVESLTAAYQSVIDAYSLTRLDFDIEMAVLNDVQSNQRRNDALAVLQDDNPELLVHYTLPLAYNGLPRNELDLLQDAADKGVNVSMINIMAMNYGNGRHNTLGDSQTGATAGHQQIAPIYPQLTDEGRWNLLGLTTAAGENDDDGVFSQEDAKALTAWAIERNIQMMSFWETDYRDRELGYAYAKIISAINRTNSVADAAGRLAEAAANTEHTARVTMQ
jgi:chitinase